jgi:hypothetical protein
MAPPSEKKAAAVLVLELAWPVASALQALRPVEASALASGAQVQPRAAEVSPVPSGRPPGAAEQAASVSAAQVQPPAAAVAGWDAAAPQQAAVVPESDVGVVRPPEVAAEVRLDAEVPQPGAAEQWARVPSARLPAAGHPSVPPWAYRAGLLPFPWLAPRQAVRSAHAMRMSRAASPSRQLWRAAGCEGLS